MTRHHCPSCESTDVFPFYRVDEVPVHSCVLLDSAEDASRFPTGIIGLNFCNSCGFIFNAEFDSRRIDYSQPYEDQQVFSPTFRAFSDRLVRELIERYDLRGKTVVEVGCGKGDFLVELCRKGDNRGIGIDPAIREDRIPSDVRSRITCVREYFAPRHTQFPADFVCCRHTLEHIPDTLTFVRNLHALANGSRQAPLFVEVPDTLRLLREGAFWDVYYEHCSYFSSSSLVRLLRNVGFDPDEVRIDYGGQYLLAMASPRSLRDASPRDGEEEAEVEEVRSLVEAFASSVEDRIGYWRARFAEWAREGKSIAIWGSGSKAVSFLTTVGIPLDSVAVVDINPYRHGKFLPLVAKEIVAPHRLAELRPEIVVVMNPLYEREIVSQLDEMGLRPEIIALA